MSATQTYDSLTLGEKATWGSQLSHLCNMFGRYAGYTLRDHPAPGLTLNAFAEIAEAGPESPDPRLDIFVAHHGVYDPNPDAAIRNRLFFVGRDDVRNFALYDLKTPRPLATGRWNEILPSIMRAFESAYPKIANEILMDQIEYLAWVREDPRPNTRPAFGRPL